MVIVKKTNHMNHSISGSGSLGDKEGCSVESGGQQSLGGRKKLRLAFDKTRHVKPVDYIVIMETNFSTV